MSSGPRSASFRSGTVAAASGTLSPERPMSLGSSLWKVNSDGTSGSIVWPNDSAIANPAEARLPPVARSRRSQRTSEPSVSVSQNDPGPADSARRSPLVVITRTPADSAARRRQSTIVAESSVTGNMRPSSSTLVSTPRAANQATVSRACQRWKAPSSSRPPRG